MFLIYTTPELSCGACGDARDLLCMNDLQHWIQLRSPPRMKDQQDYVAVACTAA